MIEWVTAATRTVWGNVRELPETVSQWQTYVELIDLGIDWPASHTALSSLDLGGGIKYKGSL